MLWLHYSVWADQMDESNCLSLSDVVTDLIRMVWEWNIDCEINGKEWRNDIFKRCFPPKFSHPGSLAVELCTALMARCGIIHSGDIQLWNHAHCCWLDDMVFSDNRQNEMRFYLEEMRFYLGRCGCFYFAYRREWLLGRALESRITQFIRILIFVGLLASPTS